MEGIDRLRLKHRPGRNEFMLSGEWRPLQRKREARVLQGGKERKHQGGEFPEVLRSGVGRSIFIEGRG